MKLGTKKEREARRMLAIPLLEKGVGPTDIARQLGVTQGAVSHWKKIFEERGREGLISTPHPGRIPSLSGEMLEKLIKLLSKGAISNGFPTEVWTLPRVAKLIERNFDIKYHPAHMTRILRKIGWSRQKPAKYAKERNEIEIEKWRNENWPTINARGQRRG